MNSLSPLLNAVKKGGKDEIARILANPTIITDEIITAVEQKNNSDIAALFWTRSHALDYLQRVRIVRILAQHKHPIFTQLLKEAGTSATSTQQDRQIKKERKR